MIIIFEQDLRTAPDGSKFRWHPHAFRGTWNGKRTWRIGWGLWSISYYPSEGLKPFFEHVEDTEWHHQA